MTMVTLPGQLDEQVREILRLHGRLRVDVGALHDTDDLYRAGLGSHANVTVMLAIEDTFGIEFPDDMLRKSTFESLLSIRSAIYDLRAAQGLA
jgi:acyl carrier protein